MSYTPDSMRMAANTYELCAERLSDTLAMIHQANGMLEPCPYYSEGGMALQQRLEQVAAELAEHSEVLERAAEMIRYTVALYEAAEESVRSDALLL